MSAYNNLPVYKTQKYAKLERWNGITYSTGQWRYLVLILGAIEIFESMESKQAKNGSRLQRYVPQEPTDSTCAT
jgi:hypothetical protein